MRSRAPRQTNNGAAALGRRCAGERLALETNALRMLAMIRTTGRFGINVLERGQGTLATRFARRGDDKFAGIAWSMDHDLPRIHGAGSWIACCLDDLLNGGDHGTGSRG